MPKEGGYWIIIPPPIVADNNLPAGAKILFGKILGLINKKGYCWASADYLGKHIGLAKDTVKKYLSLLYEKGYLRYELVQKSDKQVEERRIYPTLGDNNPLPGGIPMRLFDTESNKERDIKISNSKNFESLREIVDKWRKPNYV